MGIKFSAMRHGDRKGYHFRCPGCETLHMILTDKGNPQWDFNGDLEKPTVMPSIRVRGTELCHSFVTNGYIRFLDDCTHKLKGKTVEIPDWE